MCKELRMLPDYCKTLITASSMNVKTQQDSEAILERTPLVFIERYLDFTSSEDFDWCALPLQLQAQRFQVRCHVIKSKTPLTVTQKVKNHYQQNYGTSTGCEAHSDIRNTKM